MASPTLFARIGEALGIDPATAVDVVTDGFVEALIVDDSVKQFFTSIDKAKHKKHLANFVSMAFGNPDANYNFSKEGVDNLTKAHAGMGITTEHFGVVAGHLQAVMLAANVPEDLVAEAMAIVGSTKGAVLGEE